MRLVGAGGTLAGDMAKTVADTAAQAAGMVRRAGELARRWRGRVALVSQVGLWVGLVTTAMASCSSCSSLGEVTQAAGAAVAGYSGGVAAAGDLADSIDQAVLRLEAKLALTEWTPTPVYDAAVAEREAAKRRALDLSLQLEEARERLAHQRQQAEAAITEHAGQYHAALERAEVAEAALADLAEACAGDPPDFAACFAAIAALADDAPPAGS